MCAARVCGYKSIGRKSKGSAWWDDEMKELVKDKRKLFEVYTRNRREDDRQAYKRKNQEVKTRVRQKKDAADERFGVRLSTNFRECKKVFWSEMNRQ